MKYPDKELIGMLRAQYSGEGIESMTQVQIMDLINHTTELVNEQAARIDKMEDDFIASVLRNNVQSARIEKLEKALTSIALIYNAELFDVESLPREQLTDDAQILFDIQKITDEARNA